MKGVKVKRNVLLWGYREWWGTSGDTQNDPCDMTEKCFLGHKESCQQTKPSFNLISGEIQPPPLLHRLGNMDDEFVPVHVGTDSLES